MNWGQNRYCNVTSQLEVELSQPSLRTVTEFWREAQEGGEVQSLSQAVKVSGLSLFVEESINLNCVVDYMRSPCTRRCGH